MSRLRAPPLRITPNFDALIKRLLAQPSRGGCASSELDLELEMFFFCKCWLRLQPNEKSKPQALFGFVVHNLSHTVNNAEVLKLARLEGGSPT